MSNFIKDAEIDAQAFLRSYRSNTSSNSIICELIEQADHQAKNELEELIMGKMIEKALYEDITYGDIGMSRDILWNFLLFTGYLKAVRQKSVTDTI